MPTILFLCSGNYYRSRYAELLFNHLAQEIGLHWQANSRGLIVDRSHNAGPISIDTLAALRRAGIEPPQAGIERYPVQVKEEELAGADRVVALKEAEHRSMLAERFSGWEERVIYWHIHDLDRATASAALGEIEVHVRALIDELAASQGVDTRAD